HTLFCGWERVAVGVVLARRVAGAQAEDEASSGEELECRADFAQERRIAIALPEHECAPSESRMLTRVVRDERKALQNWRVVELEVVDHPASQIVLRGHVEQSRIR